MDGRRKRRNRWKKWKRRKRWKRWKKWKRWKGVVGKPWLSHVKRIQGAGDGRIVLLECCHMGPSAYEKGLAGLPGKSFGVGLKMVSDSKPVGKK